MKSQPRYVLEYGRGTVEDAKEGHEGVWHGAAKYIFGLERHVPPTADETKA